MQIRGSLHWQGTMGQSPASVGMTVSIPRRAWLRDAGGVLGGGGLLLAIEHEGAPCAALVRGMVDLLPEADEVVDRGDDGDDGHPVDRGQGDEVDADDEAAVEAGEEEPVVPTVGEDG